MKLRLLLVISLLWFFSGGVPSVSSQENLNSILLLADSLSSTGLHQDAITEFHRVVFWAQDSSLTSQALYRMGLEYREMEKWEKALHSFQKAMNFSTNDSVHQEIQIALATTYLASGNTNMAMLELIPIAHSSSYQSLQREATFFLIVCTIVQHNWNQARAFFEDYCELLSNQSVSDSVVIKTRKLLKEASDFSRKSPRKAKFLSTVVPGLGQLYAKDVRNALNAFALNAANFSVVLSSLWRADYQTAILYFLLVAERYYAGNRFQAEQSALKSNSQADEAYLRKILSEIRMLY